MRLRVSLCRRRWQRRRQLHGWNLPSRSPTAAGWTAFDLLSRGGATGDVLRYRSPAGESADDRRARDDRLPARRWHFRRRESHARSAVEDDDRGRRSPWAGIGRVVDARHLDRRRVDRRRADDAVGCVRLRRAYREGDRGHRARVVFRGRRAGLLLDLPAAGESARHRERRARHLAARERAGAAA